MRKANGKSDNFVSIRFSQGLGSPGTLLLIGNGTYLREISRG